jgi:hypothetical protein
MLYLVHDLAVLHPAGAEVATPIPTHPAAINAVHVGHRLMFER